MQRLRNYVSVGLTCFALTSLARAQFTAQVAQPATTVTAGVAVTPFTPVTTSGGTAPVSFSVQPPLPAGLGLNSATGEVSGIADIAAAIAPFAGGDDFNAGTATKWAYAFRISGTNGSLDFTNSRLEFTKAGGSGSFFRGWDGDPATPNQSNGIGASTTASFATNWVADVTVSNAFATATSGEFASIGFEVTNDSGEYAAIMLGNGIAPVIHTEGTGTAVVDATATSVNNVRLRFAWNASTQSLTASYSYDGSSFTTLKTFSPATEWTQGASRGFYFEVFGNSNAATAIAGGTITADNFNLKATSPAAALYKVTATDGAASPATANATFTLAVAAPALVASRDVASATATAGVALSTVKPVGVTGGVPPYGLTLTPVLPEGVTFDATTGSVAGTPTAGAALAPFAGSDDFNTGSAAKWAYAFRLSGTNGSLDFANSRLDFTKAGGAGSYFRGWDGDPSAPGTAFGGGASTTASFATSWVADLTVSNTFAAASAGEFLNLGFEVTNANGEYLALMLSGADMARIRAENAADQFSEAAATAANNVRLRLAWSVSAQTLTASYSYDGTSYTTLRTISPATAWPHGAAGGFYFEVLGNSNAAAAVPGGTAFADNFSLKATSVAAAVYTLTATDRAGTVASNTFTLAVNPPAPVIANISPANAAPGSTVTISGTDLAGASSVKFNNITASFTYDPATQTISATVPGNARSGAVVVTTASGSSAGFALTVPFTITSQPSHQVVTEGQATSLGVLVGGGATSGTYTFQWRRGGAELPGATGSALYFGAATEANVGDYDVVVSDGTTTLTSGPAALRIATASVWDWRNRLPAGNDFANVAYGNGRYVAVGWSGTIVTSTDGVSWAAQPQRPPAALLNVAFNGSEFVIVGSNGNVLRSADGLVWTQHNTSAFFNLSSVAWGNGRWVAAGAGGAIFTSTDAVAWTRQTSPIPNTINGVTATATGFLAVSGAGHLLTGDASGTTWTATQVAPGVALFDVKQSNGVTVLAGREKIYVSSDGTTFSEAALPVSPTTDPGIDWNRIVVTGAGFKVAGASYVTSSPNPHGYLVESSTGATWTQASIPGGPGLQGIASDGTSYVAVGLLGQIVSSDTGATWTTRSTGFAMPGDLWGGATGANGTIFVGNGGSVFRATNNVDGWTKIDLATNYNLYAATNAAGNYVVVGGNDSTAVGAGASAVFSSTTGEAGSWTKVDLAGPAFLGAVVFNPAAGKFVTAGAGDSIYYATNPAGAWTAVSKPTSAAVRAGAAGGGKFVLVGDAGAVLYSNDGQAWTSATAVTGVSLQAAAYGNGRFVAAGSNPSPGALRSVIITSTDGISWQPVSVPFTGSIRALTFADGRFIAVGGTSSVLISNDGFSWSADTSQFAGLFRAIVRAPAGYLAAGTGGAIAMVPAPAATTTVASINTVATVPLAPVTPVTASGGHAPYTFSISPALPAGLTFNSFTGAIAGTPALAALTPPFAGADNFDSGSDAKWAYFFRTSGAGTGNGAIAFTNGRLEFSKAAGAGSYFLGWDVDGVPENGFNRTTATFATSWVADVTVSNTFTPAVGEFASIGLQAAANGQYAAVMLGSGSALRAEGVGTTAVDLAGASTTVHLRLTWDAAAQTLTASTSEDGVSYTARKTFHPTTEWAPGGAAGGFALEIFGNSNAAAAIAGGAITVDNFSVVATSPATAIHTVTASDELGVTGKSAFTLSVGAPATIANVSPAAARVGDTVTIDGSNFSGVTAVKFGALDAASFTVVSPTQITAVVPNGASNAAISVITSSLGTAASPAAFTVLSPPLLRDQPFGRRVVAGGSVEFRVGVSGTTPFTYQWRKDSVDLPGATSATLRLGAVGSDQAGAYSVYVTNADGNATSDAATLEVLPADPILWQQFTEQATEQAPARTFHHNGKVYVPWSVQDRIPDVAGGRWVGPLARFDEATGALDPSFRLDPRFRAVTHAVVQPDGQIVAAVRVGDAMTVVRVSSTNGALDSSFTAPLFARGIRFVALQADGRVLVVATDVTDNNAPAGTLAADGPRMFRLNTNGTLDGSFTTTVFNDAGILFAPPVLDADGRIYLAGTFNNVNGTPRINVARLDSAGVLDAAYAVPATIPGFGSVQARGIVLQSDGRAVFVGDFRSAARGTGADPMMAIRFGTDGAFDAAFARPLRSQLGLGVAGQRARFAVRGDNDQLVLVSDRLVRLNADGTVDPGFARRAFERESFWVSRGSDGKFYVPDQTGVAGVSITLPVTGNGIARFAADGTPDLGFQTGGWGRIAFPTDGVVLSDGRVWVAGNFNRYGSAYMPGVAQFAATVGLTTTNVASSRSMTAATIADAGGDRIFAILGSTGNSSDAAAPVFVRLQADGTADTGFAPVLPAGYNLSSTALHTAPGGGVILAQATVSAEAALNGSAGDALIRLTASGARDTAFAAPVSSLAEVLRDGSGNVMQIRTGGLNVAQVLADGRVLVIAAGLDGSVELGRLLAASGALDSSFNSISFGTAVADFGFTPVLTDPVTHATDQFSISSYDARDLVRAAVQMPNGQVYVGGRFALSGAPRGLVRLNSDGSLDASFTGAGIASSAADAGPYVDALTVDASGRVYVAGRFESFNGTAVPGIFRLRADGSLDTAWSAGFQVTDVPRASVSLQAVGEKLYAFGTVAREGDALPPVYRIADIPAPLTITAQPLAATVLVGAPAALQVAVASTTAVTYQWFKDGAPVDAATTATLALASATLADEADYRVVATNAAGSITSATVRLTVNQPPQIVAQPVPFTVNAGGTATFTVAATGKPAVAYQWLKGTAEIAGATNASLALSNVQPGDAGSYAVRVSNSAGAVVSDSAALAVNTLPLIATQPVSLVRTAGQDAVFSVVASGNPAPAYQWHKDGGDISGATAATLTLNAVTLAQAGRYSVTATNAAGFADSSEATLTVNVLPAITAQPQNQTVLVGQSASFAVTASGTPAPTYQWRRNGSAIAGATNATLTLTGLNTTGTSTISVLVSNAAGVVPSADATLTVNPLAPAITSPLSASAVVGRSFVYGVTTNATPATLSASGLPAGLAFDAATGVISGVPTTDGTFNVSLSAANVTATDTRTLTLTITVPPPIINSAIAASGRVNQAFSYAIQAVNTPTGYGAGILPAGLTINPSTGVISGLPTAAGTFEVTLSATNAGGTTTRSLLITIDPALNAPVYTGALQLSATQGAAFTFTPAFGSGVTSYALVNLRSGAASALPTGVTLDATSGVIAGTPTQTGTFNFALQATSPGGSTAAQLSLVVNPAPTAPVVTSASLAAARVGSSFSFTLASAPAATSFAASNLPSGLTLVGNTISGTPSVLGTYNVSVSATNGAGTGPVSVLVLTVAPSASAPTITSTPVASGRAREAFTYQLAASNTPTSFEITSGTLPAGLTFDPASGAIGGTPEEASQARVWFAARNGSGRGYALEILFDILPALTTPVVTSNGSAIGQVGQPFQYVVTATNAPTGFAATGLPAGLTLNATSGVISGLPLEATTTAASVALTATNASGTSVPKTLQLTIAPAPATPVITSAATAAARVGTSFSYQITASENPTSFVAVNLPAGLSVDATSGVISGTPTTAGGSTLTLRAGNAAGLGTAATLALAIAPAPSAPAITSSATTSGKVGVSFSYATTAAPGTITGFALSGTLPLGLTFNTSTGVLSGKPAESGLFNVMLTATSDAGSSLPQSLLILIAPADNVPVVTSATKAVATVGTLFSYTITATNVDLAPVTLDAVNLPAGLAVNASTGVIQGRPQTAGTFTVSLFGTNGAGVGPARDLTLIVQPAATAPVVRSTDAVSAQVGQPFTYQIAATNSPTSFDALGTPAWLTLNNTTGAMAGIPTTPGLLTLQLSATNSAGTSSPVTLTVAIAAAPNTPVISSSRTATGLVGATFSYAITATNTPTSFVATGLPAGLTLGSDGVISGRATASGQFEVTLLATNANGTGTPVTLILLIQPNISFVTPGN